METFNNVYTPYIGANGNWYINNEDTGVKTQGPTGPQGPSGQSGVQGLIGPNGEVGDRGPQGIQGPTGATGTQGLKGDKGDTGLQGEKGDTPDLAVDLKTTVTGKALDATMGKVLDDKIVDVNRNLTTVKSYTFTPYSDYSTSNVFLRILNGVLYTYSTVCIVSMDSWTAIPIGIVANWDKGQIENICTLHAPYGADSINIILNVGKDGVVTVKTHAAVTASPSGIWTYGRSSHCF